jgi:hypothetical protein
MARPSPTPACPLRLLGGSYVYCDPAGAGFDSPAVAGLSTPPHGDAVGPAPAGLNRLIAPAGLSPALTPASRAHQLLTPNRIKPDNEMRERLALSSVRS